MPNASLATQQSLVFFLFFFFVHSSGSSPSFFFFNVCLLEYPCKISSSAIFTLHLVLDYNLLCSLLYSRCSTPETTIALLLRRGADPNESSLPLSPLVYAIRSGDLPGSAETGREGS